MPRKKKTDVRDLPKLSGFTENLHPCPRCGSLMVETETGRYCPTCHLVEWIDEGGAYTSGLAKCPACHNMSPNSLICSYCAYPINENTRKLFEEKNK